MPGNGEDRSELRADELAFAKIGQVLLEGRPELLSNALGCTCGGCVGCSLRRVAQRVFAERYAAALPPG